MAKIPFYGKIRPSGNVYIVTVPKSYVDNGIIQKGKPYKFEVEDVDNIPPLGSWLDHNNRVEGVF